MKEMISGLLVFQLYVCFLYPVFFLQGLATARPEEELDRLTKKLVYDMNHPPVEDYFGTDATHYMNDFWHCKPCIHAFKIKQMYNIVRVNLPLSGRCARCGDNVVGDGSGCIAMEQVFHVECFTCITCHARLRGQPFYALDKKSYCESCYIVSKGATVQQRFKFYSI